MGIDAWTRTPYEQKWRERAERHKRNKNRHEPFIDRAKEYVKNRWNGEHHKCACGCGKPGDMFRDGKRYNARCVSNGSGWNKAGLPQDRTMPMTGSRKREIRKNSRWLEKENG